MRQIGTRPRNRVVALREVVSACRSLLRGESVTVTGDHVELQGVALDHPPGRPPPILIGTTGTQGIALAGELADGLLLPEGSAPAAITWATESLCRPIPATVYAWTRVEDDRERALDRVRPIVRSWREGSLYPNLLVHSGLSATGDPDDSQIENMAIAGAPRDCTASISRMHAAGAASLVFVPVGDDHEAQLERIATDVLPLVAATPTVDGA